jgi:hypothetical protein
VKFKEISSCEFVDVILWISYVSLTTGIESSHHLPPEMQQKLNKLGNDEVGGDVQVFASSLRRVVDGL